ncbi:hypothetical protein JKP88DRAFT_252762 [Tribonema minus]|uniref:Uncharacterized protein n=1 Tax=Tribonema minus TaxID=303371 RepID=A0A835ZAK1_9STRA|nr:hypothetical protein JKP88DRAFT_252762 [Tribonema minus]
MAPSPLSRGARTATADAARSAACAGIWRGTCDLCKARKRKCSGGDPCQMCRRKGVSCNYSKALKRGPKSSSKHGLLFGTGTVLTQSLTQSTTAAAVAAARRADHQSESTAMMIIDGASCLAQQQQRASLIVSASPRASAAASVALSRPGDDPLASSRPPAAAHQVAVPAAATPAAAGADSVRHSAPSPLAGQPLGTEEQQCLDFFLLVHGQSGLVPRAVLQTIAARVATYAPCDVTGCGSSAHLPVSLLAGGSGFAPQAPTVNIALQLQQPAGAADARHDASFSSGSGQAVTHLKLNGSPPSQTCAAQAPPLAQPKPAAGAARAAHEAMLWVAVAIGCVLKHRDAAPAAPASESGQRYMLCASAALMAAREPLPETLHAYCLMAWAHVVLDDVGARATYAGFYSYYHRALLLRRTLGGGSAPHSLSEDTLVLLELLRVSQTYVDAFVAINEDAKRAIDRQLGKDIQRRCLEECHKCNECLSTAFDFNFTAAMDGLPAYILPDEMDIEPVFTDSYQVHQPRTPQAVLRDTRGTAGAALTPAANDMANVTSIILALDATLSQAMHAASLSPLDSAEPAREVILRLSIIINQSVSALGGSLRRATCPAAAPRKSLEAAADACTNPSSSSHAAAAQQQLAAASASAAPAPAARRTAVPVLHAPTPVHVPAGHGWRQQQQQPEHHQRAAQNALSPRGRYASSTNAAAGAPPSPSAQQQRAAGAAAARRNGSFSERHGLCAAAPPAHETPADLMLYGMGACGFVDESDFCSDTTGVTSPSPTYPFFEAHALPPSPTLSAHAAGASPHLAALHGSSAARAAAAAAADDDVLASAFWPSFAAAGGPAPWPSCGAALLGRSLGVVPDLCDGAAQQRGGGGGGGALLPPSCGLQAGAFRPGDVGDDELLAQLAAHQSDAGNVGTTSGSARYYNVLNNLNIRHPSRRRCFMYLEGVCHAPEQIEVRSSLADRLQAANDELHAARCAEAIRKYSPSDICPGTIRNCKLSDALHTLDAEYAHGSNHRAQAANDELHAAWRAKAIREYSPSDAASSGAGPRTGDLAWSALLLRFRHAEADRAHAAHKAAFRRYNLRLICNVLAVTEGVALVKNVACLDWIGVAQLAAVVVTLLAAGNCAQRLSERGVAAACVLLTALLHGVFFALMVADAAGRDLWTELRQGVTPNTLYTTLIMVFDFMLAPYWFTNPDTPTSMSDALASTSTAPRQTEAALEALRLLAMAAAVAYMTHASLLELFASPTEGLLKALALGVREEKEQYISQALALGVREEKEQYISQVAHDIGTPLTTFALGLQLLREDPELTPSMHQVLDMQPRRSTCCVSSPWRHARCRQRDSLCNNLVTPVRHRHVRTRAIATFAIVTAFPPRTVPASALYHAAAQPTFPAYPQTVAMDALNAMRRQALDAVAFSNGHRPRPVLTRGSVRAVTFRCMQIMRADLARGWDSTPHQAAAADPAAAAEDGALADANAAAAAAAAAPIEWHWHVEDDVKRCIVTDFAWVQDMLLHLLTNAKQHATGTRRVVTMVAVADDGRRLRFAVRDYGLGLSLHSSAGLFQKFGQLEGHDARTPRGGLGLGLYGVSIKARALGGSYGVDCLPAAGPLDAASGAGAGTEFWFSVAYVPYDERAPLPLPPPLPPPPPSPGDDSDAAAAPWRRGSLPAAADFAHAAGGDGGGDGGDGGGGGGGGNGGISPAAQAAARFSSTMHAAWDGINGGGSVHSPAVTSREDEPSGGMLCAGVEPQLVFPHPSAAQLLPRPPPMATAAAAPPPPSPGASAAPAPGASPVCCSGGSGGVPEPALPPPLRAVPEAAAAWWLPRPRSAEARHASVSASDALSPPSPSAALHGAAAMPQQHSTGSVMDSNGGGGGGGDVARRSAAAAAPARARPAAAGEERRLILVVDDESTIRKFLARVLEKRGYGVVQAGDGVQALEAMRACAFTAHAPHSRRRLSTRKRNAPRCAPQVLLDNYMPRMNGIDTLLRLRQLEARDSARTRQYVIVVSANCSAAHEEEALGSGADLFHAKPINVPVLALDSGGDLLRAKPVNVPALCVRISKRVDQYAHVDRPIAPLGSGPCLKQVAMSSAAATVAGARLAAVIA